MRWINIEDDIPKRSGKYIVKTRTSFNNINAFLAGYKYNEEKQSGTFDVSNQRITHWLKYPPL